MPDLIRRHPEEEFIRAGIYGNPPCPICGKDWCGYNSFICSCMRVVEGSFKTVIQSNGKPAYQHWLKPGTVNYTKVNEQPTKNVEAASVETLDRVYREFLNHLSLYPEHRDDLMRRGLTEKEIKKSGYKSIPQLIKPWDICMKLKDRGFDLAGIPGFYKTPGRNGGNYWTFGWQAGYFIPVLDVKGRIQALQRRMDDSNKGGKYKLFTTLTKFMRCSSGTPAHVVTPVEIKDRRVWITEGPLKADIAAKYLGAVVIGIMSSGTWIPAVKMLKEIGAKEVVTAYDMDFKTNKYVSEPLEMLKGELKKMDLVVYQAMWSEVKGIDDALVGKKKITVRGS